MSKKDSFAKLTEDLEKLEQLEKSVEEVEVVNPEPEAEPEVVEEEVEKAANCPDCGKAKADCTCKVEKSEDEEDKDEDKKDDKKKDDKKKVEKSEDEDEEKEDVKKSAEEPVVEEEVSKSVEEPVDAVTEQDFLGAFEAVVKSYSGLQEKHNLVVSELSEIKKSLGEVLEFISKAAHQLSFGEEVKVGEPSPEQEEEVVEKSVAQPEEEELEGKAVEFVAKSVEGIPDVAAVEPVVEAVEEPVARFNPIEHVSAITDYFMKNNSTLNEGQKYALRGAVNRVKRGDGTANDTELFKEILQISE